MYEWARCFDVNTWVSKKFLHTCLLRTYVNKQFSLVLLLQVPIAYFCQPRYLGQCKWSSLTCPFPRPASTAINSSTRSGSVKQLSPACLWVSLCDLCKRWTVCPMWHTACFTSYSPLEEQDLACMARWSQSFIMLRLVIARCNWRPLALLSMHFFSLNSSKEYVCLLHGSRR